jgi:PAS domain-containing protein
VLRQLDDFIELFCFMPEAIDKVASYFLAEENLRRSEERLRLIFESAQGFAIFTTDADGIINSWYVGAAQVFGWSEAEILGQKAT